MMVSLEDGITSCGFRKMAAYVGRLNADTEACYVTTNKYRGIRNALFGLGAGGELTDEDVDEVAQGLIGSDLLGFSSMTGYSELTRRIAKRVRELDPSAFMIWGGIHPIIHPEDAITAEVDAICTGEGELAFEEFLGVFAAGEDYTSVKNFWFKRGDQVIRNHFLPLMSSEEMERLPFPLYGERERIYRRGEGLVPISLSDYVGNDGLSYTTLWSIGCPFHCTYCGNTKFIANDSKYKRIRHPSARYIVDQVNDARRRFPHLSQVSFHDDSFMAIPYGQLAEFAELWKAEVGVPFAVYGVIPNYVKQDKFEILTWAGMNRIRMGIQSGSQRILDFYKRPSPPHKILAAGKVIASFAPRYHLPPAYDVIVDNPIETRQDVVDTLELLYEMPRPYTLFIYSLKVIPNTELERAMREQGVDLDEIDSSYFVIPARMGNLLLYVLCLFKPPRWLWKALLSRVRASREPQTLYPRVALVLRTLYLARRVLSHARRMDFSITPGWAGYTFWRAGVLRFWQRAFTHRLPKPERRIDARRGAGARGGARADGRAELLVEPADDGRSSQLAG
jgi:anaerobic magnesium-protoporphyrin IX monomethyl ester cyclase